MPSGLHRTYGAHHLHFITCSCYRRLPFLNRARSRDCFLSILEQVRQRYRFVVVGYAVMPEHIHLLVTEPEIGNPSKVMQVLKQRTARALLPQRRRKDPRQGSLFGEESQPRGVLASTFLRFQRLDLKKASGEAAVHASESGQTRTGGVAGAVAMEQLSFLFSRRSRSGASECGLDQDFVSRPCSVSRGRRRNTRLHAFVIPALAKNARAGHPHSWWCWQHSESGPPVPHSSQKTA